MRRAGAVRVGWADSEVWGMWTMVYCTGRYPGYKRERPKDPGYYCGVCGCRGQERRVVLSCQLPTKQIERRAIHGKWFQFTRSTCSSWKGFVAYGGGMGPNKSSQKLLGVHRPCFLWSPEVLE